MDVYALIGLGAALAVLLVFFGVAQLAGGQVTARMSRYVGQPGAGIETPPSRESVFSQLDRAMARRGLVEGIRRELLRADLRLTVPEYLVITAVVTLSGSLIGYLISRFWISALISAMACSFLPLIYVRWRQRARITAFNNQLESVLNLVVAAMRAGYSLLQSFDYISKRLPDPAATHFSRVVREVSLGLSMSEAMENLLVRTKSEDMELIVTAINIHDEVGGNLTVILETVNQTIRERVRIKQEIRSLTSMQRGSAYILVGLPFIVAGLLFVMSPTYMMRLFEPGPTLCIPSGALVCMAIGFVITRRIMNIEV
ncbi:MAG: type II secretion system F family protein [Anaerolineae bacterium]|nr:type II secretion system F family protein [Anaerolineae bacterium]